MASISLTKLQHVPIPASSLVKSPIHALPESLAPKALSYLPPKTSTATFSSHAALKSIKPHLGHLDLSGSQITGAELAQILKSCQNKEIVSLNLSHCQNITDADLTLLKDLKLTELDLSGCEKITNIGLNNLAPLPLTHLELNACYRITDTGLGFLSKLPLTILSLSNCDGITDDGLVSLSKLVLTDLDLSGCNQITDNGLGLLETLPLIRLKLQGCHMISEDGLQYLLANTKLKELIFPSNDVKEHMLFSAVKNANTQLVHILLSLGTPPDPIDEDKPSALYMATLNTDQESIKSLLQAGANPNRDCVIGTKHITPFVAAAQINDLNVISQFFIYAQPHLKPAAIDDSAILYSLDKRTLLNHIEKNEQDIAHALPPVLDSSMLHCFTKYVSSDFRKAAASHFLSPLLTPPSSVQHYIAPLQAFAAHETQNDSQFAVFIGPQSPGKAKSLGEYLPNTGIIQLFVENQTMPTTSPAVLLHELCHKAIAKLGWDVDGSQKDDFTADVEEDIDALKSDEWTHCHKAVKPLFESVDQSYDPNECFEEYLVRMPQLLFAMASENPKTSILTIETQLQKDLPHLFKIYKQFLAQLELYNKNPICLK